jgi:hypothetical protein
MGIFLFKIPFKTGDFCKPFLKIMLLNKPSGELFGLLICTKAQLINNHC